MIGSKGYQYLPKMRILFLLSHKQRMIFSWKSQVSSIFIFHTFLTVLTAGCRQDTGSAEGLKFALIKLPVRNNNSDLWFNSISILHITGFSAGILLSSEQLVSTEIFLDLFWFFDFSAASNYWSSVGGRELRIRITQSDFQLISIVAPSQSQRENFRNQKKWK